MHAIHSVHLIPLIIVVFVNQKLSFMFSIKHLF